MHSTWVAWEEWEVVTPMMKKKRKKKKGINMFMEKNANMIMDIMKRYHKRKQMPILVT
jgi:hypothetical protein